MASAPSAIPESLSTHAHSLDALMSPGVRPSPGSNRSSTTESSAGSEFDTVGLDDPRFSTVTLSKEELSLDSNATTFTTNGGPHDDSVTPTTHRKNMSITTIRDNEPPESFASGLKSPTLDHRVDTEAQQKLFGDFARLQVEDTEENIGPPTINWGALTFASLAYIVLQCALQISGEMSSQIIKSLHLNKETDWLRPSHKASHSLYED